jgi:hypothetical protein
MDIRLLKEFRKEARDRIYLVRSSGGYYHIMERHESGDIERAFGRYHAYKSLELCREDFIREFTTIARSLINRMM